MSGIINSTGARSGVIGTTVGTPAGGLSHASLWRMSSNFAGVNSSGDNIPVDPVINWEKDDTFSPGSIGSDMTETSANSGIFYRLNDPVTYQDINCFSWIKASASIQIAAALIEIHLF